jgi:hypothetical protein
VTADRLNRLGCEIVQRVATVGTHRAFQGHFSVRSQDRKITRKEPQMSAQDEYVKQNLEILRELQMSRMSYEEYASWQDKIDEVNDSYLAARAIEKDEKRTAEERKQAKKVADGIAKAAPAITKSVISAIKAFNKGDAINGSAEIMDICASLAPLISTFVSAAGPEGALIGAFFSVIGQILRCFGPKQESDVSKLEKFLNELKAQTELESIKAVHDAVLVYASTLLKQAACLQSLLAKPLRNHEDYKSFYVGLKQTSIVLGDNSQNSSVSMFKEWEVLEYLEAPDNQDVALWPTVLGICCKTYSDLVSTTMTITAMVNTDDMVARLKDVAPDSTSGLSPEARRSLEKRLLELIAYAKARKLEYESCNARMLEALTALAPAAQRWGLYGCIASNYALKFVSGPKNVKNGDWNDVSDRNYYHQLMVIPDAATTIRRGQVSSQFNFKPAYHCFVLKSTGSWYPGSNHWVDHLWVHADTMAVDNPRDVLNNFAPAFTDIWAAGETDKGLDVVAGTAEGTGAPGSVMSWGLDAKDGYNTAPLERVNSWPQTKSAVGTIRAVTVPCRRSVIRTRRRSRRRRGADDLRVDARLHRNLRQHGQSGPLRARPRRMGTVHRCHGRPELPVALPSKISSKKSADIRRYGAAPAGPADPKTPARWH